jgi:hypothetical protein
MFFIQVAAPFKAYVCGRWLAGIGRSNPAGIIISLVNVVCCQVEVSATGWSLIQRSLTECGMSVSELGTSTKRKSWPPRTVEP